MCKVILPIMAIVLAVWTAQMVQTYFAEFGQFMRLEMNQR